MRSERASEPTPFAEEWIHRYFTYFGEAPADLHHNRRPRKLFPHSHPLSRPPSRDTCAIHAAAAAAAAAAVAQNAHVVRFSHPPPPPPPMSVSPSVRLKRLLRSRIWL